MDMEDKAILITGASSGIGKAVQYKRREVYYSRRFSIKNPPAKAVI